jgi:aprataxin
LTIFDAYPKSLFHFLVLPRVVKATSTLDSNEPSQKSDDPLTSSQLSSLATLLKCGPSRAKRELLRLKEEGLVCKNKMEEEMLERYGFKWDVWMGFHASPSMEYVLGIVPQPVMSQLTLYH